MDKAARTSMVGAVLGIIAYVTGVNRAILTPFENIFFDMPEVARFIIVVGVLALVVAVVGWRVWRRHQDYLAAVAATRQAPSSVST